MEYRFVRKLIEHIKKFPGITLKQAEKLTIALLSNSDMRNNLDVIRELLNNVTMCDTCGWFKQSDKSCENCNRDSSAICVVESFSDMMSIEKTGEYKGSYHILGGLIAPLENILPEDLLITPLIKRVVHEGTEEVIIALPATIEGESTVQYVMDSIDESDVSVTRIARGLPSGSKLDHMDRNTIAFALKDRQKVT